VTYEQLYTALQAELSDLQTGTATGLAVIEKGFLIAWRYRNRLPLPDEPVSPVAYFKQWLPLFEAEIKYRELCYYAEKFGPDGALHDRQNFLLRELGRRERLISETSDLYAYIERGSNDRDEELFGGDIETAAEHAGRIAVFLSLARYNKYLELHFRNLFKQEPYDPANKY
jgi:hypothetical protein